MKTIMKTIAIEECEHKTGTRIDHYRQFELWRCDWGCGQVIITYTDDDGISHDIVAEDDAE